MFKLKRKQILIAGFLILAAVLLIFLKTRKFEPKILSVSPTNGSTDVALNASIDITFENSVPEVEQPKFFVRVLPGVPSTPIWVSPKLLRLASTAPLVSDTSYRVAVLFNEEEIYTTSFKTKYVKEYTAEETQELRSMAIETASAFNQLDATYPFLRKLPIESDSYRVVFDFDLKQFRIRLKMPSTAPEETKQEAQNGALSALQVAEIDITPYGYYVLYSD